jgi:hypothetical protein
MKPQPVAEDDPGYLQSLRDERAASQQLRTTIPSSATPTSA